MALKVRMKPKFPARVSGGTGVAVTKSGGSYVFSIDGADFSEYLTVEAADLDDIFVLTYSPSGSPVYGRVGLDVIVDAVEQGSDITLTTLGVSAFAQTFLDDTTAGAVFTTLGISAFAQTLLDDAAAGNVLTTLGVSAFVQTILNDAAAGDVLTTLGVSAFAQTLLDDAAATNARTTLGLAIGTDVLAYDAQLFSNVPQNSQSAAYTLVLTDGQKQILHPSADNNARTFTIPANASVAFPIGTAVTFVNEINTVTIAITSDTLTFAGAGTTGSRTLAANGLATALKVGSTKWVISGAGLT